MKKAIFLNFLFIPYYFCLCAQINNDYRTNGNNGNWTNTSIWEVYNGTAWVAATNYPGQITGTNNISIEGNSEVTINTIIPNSFNSLSITSGKLLIGDDATLNTLLITLYNNGLIEWITNNTDLALPMNAVIIISGGNLVEETPCNATKTLTIGTTVYASCNGGGGGVDIDFSDINNNGGTLNALPTSNAPLCLGQPLSLFANPSGAGSSGASYSWSGSGPNEYSFNSTLENPTDTTISTIGTYTFTITITDSFSNSNSNTLNIIVNEIPNSPQSQGNQTVCSGTTATLNATVGSSETVDWYDAIIGGALLLANNTNFTTSVSGSYYAETRNTNSGCTSSNRTEIILYNKSCTVITNRRITYRVRQ